MNKNGRTNALNSQFSTSKKKKFDKNNSLIHQSKNRSCVNQKFYQKISKKRIITLSSIIILITSIWSNLSIDFYILCKLI
jgi:hypothetical protein